MEKVREEKQKQQLLATKSSYPSNLWDCGSTLYDSFELNSFKRELDSAIGRTISMPRLPERSVHAVAEQPRPSIAMSRKSFNISRSFQKLLRSIFKSNNKSSTIPRESLYVVYDKSGPVLSTIPELPEFEIAALSPEISSFVPRYLTNFAPFHLIQHGFN
ncbi:hypothetical protein CR513_14497, partial [Mucuna pruriens]